MTNRFNNCLFGFAVFSAVLIQACAGTNSVEAASRYRCDFLPERPAPAWISTGWKKSGYYVGVGMAERRATAEEQIEASRQKALNDISGKISVSVTSTLKDKMVATARGGIQRLEQTIEMETQTSVKQTLRDVEYEDTWLDRKNCALWTLATVSKESVMAVQREIEEKIRKKFTSKKVMLFASPGVDEQPGMGARIEGGLKTIFEKLNMEIIPAQEKYRPCSEGRYEEVCRERPDTIFGLYGVDLVKEKYSSDKSRRARYYKFNLAFYLKNRNIASFADVSCRGISSADRGDEEINAVSADACVKKIRKKLKRKMESGSEK